MSDNRTVLITGAAGFLGARLVEAMTFTGVARPRAMVRRWGGAARIARFPVEIVLADLMDRPSLDRAMAGVDTVIHCAYVDDREVILDGTRHVLEAAVAHRVRRFIHLSTAEVYGVPRGRVDESHPYGYTGSVYGDAKIDAEKLVFEYVADGVRATVLRPSIVYGPHSEQWIVNFAERLQSGSWGVFKGYGEGICNLVYVDDLVAAILKAMDDPAAIGEAFNVNGPESITWNEYFRRFNALLGLPPLREIDPSRARLRTAVMGPVSAGLIFAKHHLGKTVKAGADRFGFAGRELLKRFISQTRSSVRSAPSARELESLFSRNAVYVADKIHDRLGFTPRFDTDMGLRLSVAWLDHHALIRDDLVRVPAPKPAAEAVVR